MKEKRHMYNECFSTACRKMSTGLKLRQMHSVSRYSRYLRLLLGRCPVIRRHDLKGHEIKTAVNCEM